MALMVRLTEFPSRPVQGLRGVKILTGLTGFAGLERGEKSCPPSQVTEDARRTRRRMNGLYVEECLR